jgi:Tol biopolymer transport system component
MILHSIPAEGGEGMVLDTGAPYYWSWAPDGQTMVVHAGGGAVSAERVAFLQVDSEVQEDGLELFPAAFQAPAWSPDGSRILLAVRDDESGENSIIVTDAAGVLQKTLGTFSGEAAFAWSNDGEKVAYIASDQQIDTGLLGELHIVNLTTSEEIVQERTVFAFFWSPNGEKLAYFVPYLNSAATPQAEGETASTPEVLMQLNVLDVSTGENSEQYTFSPTQDFLRVLTYFDQYHQSNTIWSPDNNNLVLSFFDQQGQPGIAVVAASGRMEPRLLANGFLAFWSWK